MDFFNSFHVRIEYTVVIVLRICDLDFKLCGAVMQASVVKHRRLRFLNLSFCAVPALNVNCVVQ